MKAKFVVLLLLLIGFGLRVHGLDLQPLWGDEGWSFYFAAMPLGEMAAKTAIDIHPPLYYAILHLWLNLIGFDPEAARFVSVVFGTILIAVGYQFGRELLAGSRQGAWLGLAFAGVLTVAPMAVYYSQEVRMYSLVTLLGLASTLYFLRLSRGQPAAFWPYVILTTLVLYTEYYGVLLPLFQGIYWLLYFRKLPFRQRQTIFKAFLVIGLTYLPWLIYAGPKTVAYVQGKNAVETDVEGFGYVPLSLPVFVARYLTAFSLGHPSDLWQPYLWVTVFFVVIAGFGWFYLWRQPNRPIPLLLVSLYLGVSLTVGWLINLVSPFTPPYFERTLLLAAPAWWLLLAAGLVWWWERQRLLLSAIASLLLLVNVVGLLDFYSLPRYVEQDYRPMLAKIAAIAEPDDVLLASYQWQLGLYEAYLPQVHPRYYEVPAWGVTWGTDPARMRTDLFDLLAQTVWFPAHQTAGRDWETRAEQMMAEMGFPALLEWANPSTKLSLVGGRTAVASAPSTFNFDSVLSADAALSPNSAFQSGRGIIPIEIQWTKRGSLGSEHLVTLRLVDPTGEIWASRDSLPQAAQASFIELELNESLIDHHGLLIPAGTPPGIYQLRLSVTDEFTAEPLDLVDNSGQPQGVEAILAEIEVIPPQQPAGVEALAVQQQVDENFEDQLKLVGASVGQWTVKTGEVLPVNLFWQGLTDQLPDLTFFVQLQDEQGQALALTERPPSYPTTAWSSGTLLRDLHRLRLPATVPPGQYKLVAGVLRPDKSRLQVDGTDQVILGQVTVEGRPHEFDPPQPQVEVDAIFGDIARLVGYDLAVPTALAAGDAVQLTLYWQSKTNNNQRFERNWTIFAHIVDVEGRIWGQRDQLPGAGEFPTTSWVPEEYITDNREIVLNPDTPPGTYFIEIGLYDANSATFERLLLGPEDSFTLEIPLVVK